MNKKRLHPTSANTNNNAANDRMCVGLELIENTATIGSDNNHSTHTMAKQLYLNTVVYRIPAVHL